MQPMLATIFGLVVETNGKYTCECCLFKLNWRVSSLRIPYNLEQILNAYIPYIAGRMEYVAGRGG